ncbi:MAG: bpX5 domain-containing protein [Myxococcaceae bacterium]
MTALGFGWAPRAEPLAPRAVAATGAAARALAERALELGPEAVGRLRGVAGDGVLLLLGEEADLPWADGVSYLGVDPAAPSLLLPCARAPDVPARLVEQAVARRASGPVAVLCEPPALIRTGDARPVSSARLAAWLAGR